MTWSGSETKLWSTLLCQMPCHIGSAHAPEPPLDTLILLPESPNGNLPLAASKDECGGPADESDAALQLLVAAGLVTPPADQSDVAPVSDEERRDIADVLGQSPGSPLSDLIIKSRRN